MRASLSVQRPLRSESLQPPSHAFRLSWAHSMISASGLSLSEQMLVDFCGTEVEGSDVRVVRRSGGAVRPRGPL